jgi:hypothetical protein
MKNRLQYIYSIGVFCGVLVTAYMMMNQDESAHLPVRTFQSPALRAEATSFDPGMTQLFEMEDAINKIRKDKPEAKRVPSDAKNPIEKPVR